MHSRKTYYGFNSDAIEKCLGLGIVVSTAINESGTRFAIRKMSEDCAMPRALDMNSYEIAINERYSPQMPGSGVLR